MKNSDTKPKQRIHDRVSAANLMLEYSDGRRFYSEYLHNISLGGICLEVLKPIEPGARLTISLSTKPALKIEGDVKWTDKHKFRYRIGVQFVKVTREQEFRLRQIIQSLFWEASQPQ